jgi:hypothetical protein
MGTETGSRVIEIETELQNLTVHTITNARSANRLTTLLERMTPNEPQRSFEHGDSDNRCFMLFRSLTIRRHKPRMAGQRNGVRMNRLNSLPENVSDPVRLAQSGRRYMGMTIECESGASHVACRRWAEGKDRKGGPL